MLKTPDGEIRDAYLAGATQQELAVRFGVSQQTIARRLRAQGVQLRDYTGPRQGRAPRFDVPLDEVREMAGRMSTAEIGAALGVPPEVVRERMVRAGIPRLAARARPERNAFWKEGRTWVRGGYVAVLVPGHPLADSKRSNYVAEHRLVVEAELGRYLLPGEVVDHRNGCTTDNQWENLRVFPSNADHLRGTLSGRPKRSRSWSSFDPVGATPAASETGAEPSLRRHPLFPFPLGTAGLALSGSWPSRPSVRSG